LNPMLLKKYEEEAHNGILFKAKSDSD
jgi:hypothetical protein